MTNAASNQASSQQPAGAISWVGFRVPSQDTHGHSERVWFRCQPGVARDLNSIIEMKMWPYRDRGDLVRHAIDRHLKWLQAQVPIASVTKQVDVILEIMREEEFHADFRQVFEKLGQRVAVYVQLGSDREARSLVNRVKQYILDMPDGDWKSRYEKEMEDKFGHLIANARGVMLDQWLDDGQEVESLAMVGDGG